MAAEKPLNNSSPIALGLALLALAGVAGMGVAWGDSRSRLSNVEKNEAEVKARVLKVEDASATHAVTDAAVQADVRNIKEGVKDLGGKMDRLLEQRGVRQAGGGR